MKATDRRKKEKLKLDQMMRVLFRLSKRLTVQLINGLFGESFADTDVKAIHYGNAEFISDEYERIVGDLFMKLDTRLGPVHYHVEFQTMNDQSMVIRMFRYGFEKALEVAAGEAEDGVPLVIFPKQIVIFLEENEAIGDELLFRMRMPDGTEMVYKVPVLRYWTLTARDLQERKLFALLPLQVFSSRKNMRLIAASQRSDNEKRRLFAGEFERLKATIRETLDVIQELHGQQQIWLGDMDKILRVLDNIVSYLYRNYGDPQQNEEASRMIKTFIDPEILKKGRKEGREEGLKEGLKEGRREGLQEGKLAVARNLLKLGVDIGTIVEATGLTPEEVAGLGRRRRQGKSE
ncbi:Rpn family recombination-promoting nuclease/putative transposase [Cohnella soli]|uniref:Rpn family recombination-promoting nuclease/putative transposase n=1 Tax=Cohnella soli TaxID=425005 RepID=A0ABW0HTF8_9BACL